MELGKIYKILKLVSALVSALSDGILTEEELDRIEKALIEIVGERS